MNWKRMIICLIGGVIAGIICILGMKSSGKIALTSSILAAGMVNRIMIGFVIAISSWEINYLLHGAIIGAIVSLGNSVVIIAQRGFESGIAGFFLYTIAGAVYGLLIELTTTKAFKAKML